MHDDRFQNIFYAIRQLMAVAMKASRSMGFVDTGRKLSKGESFQILNGKSAKRRRSSRAPVDSENLGLWNYRLNLRHARPRPSSALLNRTKEPGSGVRTIRDPSDTVILTA